MLLFVANQSRTHHGHSALLLTNEVFLCRRQREIAFVEARDILLVLGDQVFLIVSGHDYLIGT